MSQTRFEYDVFLSHSSKDKSIVRKLAERLKTDGLRVWLDEWVIKAGDPISLKVQQGIEQSRTLVMCMSPDFFASEWAKLEHHSLLFRDPTNQQRRFIPLLLSDCQIPDMIAQFKYIDWLGQNDEKYSELINACRSDEERLNELSKISDERATDRNITDKQNRKPEINKFRDSKSNSDSCRIIRKKHSDVIRAVAITPDGKKIVSGSDDRTICIWDISSGHCLNTLEGHSSVIRAIAITPDGKKIVSASDDKKIRIWDIFSGRCLTTLEGHLEAVQTVAITPDGKKIVSGSDDRTICIWNISSGRCLSTLEEHSNTVCAVAITPDGKNIVSGSDDRTIRIWDISSGHCLNTLKGHLDAIRAIAITPDGKKIVSGSDDRTIRIWDISSGHCQITLEKHYNAIRGVAITPDGKKIVSGSWDRTIRIWDISSGRYLTALKGHSDAIQTVAITPDSEHIVSGSWDYTIRVWGVPGSETSFSSSKLYTNAKVALIGDSGVGKTGLAIRLVDDRWEITDSTHGMNVWQLPLSDLHTTEIDREVWLWDFAGQPDYRIIHQLFMDETALAVMVIDPQKENPLEPLAHWEKALSLAVKNPPPKLLVAARCERGGVTISQTKLDQYCTERGYAHFQTTSAKSGDGCIDLKDAIAKHIPWESLTKTSTSTTFKNLKDAILRIKQEEISLIRFAELHQRLQLEIRDDAIEETDLRTVVSLLGNQGLIKPLDFGDFILLRPEEINKYASVIAHLARESSDDIGCISESDVLKGNLRFPDDMPRLKSPADEEILLRAIVETFVNRSLCIREETLDGTKLVFPSYFKQERDEIKDHPNIFVTYGFSGVLDEIYSTLVVRLHYTNDFEKDQLWKYAADFKTLDEKRVGLQMNKKSEAEAEIVVYFQADVHINTQVSFIKYIHEHLLKKAKDVTRVRTYVCPHCGELLENRKAIRVRLEKGLKDIACGFCEVRVMLIDMIEEKFASDEFSRAVRKMDEDAQINLDNESLELILVGHAFTTVGEAGHIFRPTPNSDWGLDGEIEFKDTEEIIDEEGNVKVITKASGDRVYLQLKSGDSYLRQRKRDEKEIFTIKSPRWAEYWQAHKYPVMLVIRTSDGRIRWMNVTEYLKNRSADTKQIEFDGEMFTALNVAKLRDKILK